MSSPASLSLPDVPDVLYAIISYLDPVHCSQYEHDQIYESRRSLALAARTCRGFARPALDVLWKRLPDDQPLADLLCEVGIATRQDDEKDLQFLGEDKYVLPHQSGAMFFGSEEEEAYERQWRLSRGYDIRYLLRRDIDDPRKHPGWTRFVEYALRVRSITLFAFEGPAWCGIWEELRPRSLAGDGPILPRLLSVAFCVKSWSDLDGDVTPGALALIQSPSVSKLNFNLGTWYHRPNIDEKLRSLFSQCFSSAPEIDQLRLEFPPSRLGPPLLQVHCSRTRRLEVYPQLDLDGVRILSELPALQHLSISLVQENLPRANTSFKFASVTTFVVEGTWTNLSTLFDTLRLPSMHTLSVTGWEYGEPAAELVQGAVRCFKTISARQASITRLSICESTGRAPPRRGCIDFESAPVEDTFEAPFLDVVHPLLSLSALRHLSLTLPRYCYLTCTAADLRAVAESFPALETFHLPDWFKPYSNSWSPPQDDELRARDRPRGGPLTAIAHFARCCPRLRVLHLPSMELSEESLIELGDEAEHAASEPHGLRTLIIPKVLLPPGRADMVGKVSDVVKRVFPLAASAFRPEMLVMEEDWAVADNASRCPECSAQPWSISTFS